MHAHTHSHSHTSIHILYHTPREALWHCTSTLLAAQSMIGCWKCLCFCWYFQSWFAYSITNQPAGPAAFRIECLCVFCKYAQIKISSLLSMWAAPFASFSLSADFFFFLYLFFFLRVLLLVHVEVRLAGLVDITQQLGDFDEASHRALRLLLQPLVVLPEALHLGLQHRLVLFLLKDIGTQQNKSRRSDGCVGNRKGSDRYWTAGALRKLVSTREHGAPSDTKRKQRGDVETHRTAVEGKELVLLEIRVTVV